MPLWLERYIFPICVAIVFGLTILNPLRLDWRQRISLAVAVSAFAYFVGHTLHRAASAPAQPDQRITFLEQQVQNLQSQQKQLEAQEAGKAQERARRQEVKKQLAVFLQEGQKIQDDLLFNNSTALRARTEWQQRVANYLAKNLDESYAVRFRNLSHQISAYPENINRGMMAPWGEVKERMAMLNDFISELRD
ncbi:MAG: hypothetical protein WCA49_14855 [Candidatus Sulfotelmatobacter sp.]